MVYGWENESFKGAIVPRIAFPEPAFTALRPRRRRYPMARRAFQAAEGAGDRASQAGARASISPSTPSQNPRRMVYAIGRIAGAHTISSRARSTSNSPIIRSTVSRGCRRWCTTLVIAVRSHPSGRVPERWIASSLRSSQ